MAGFKSKKIFCMDMSRLSGKPCQAKGFPTNKFNKYGFQVYKCRFHGGQNTNFYGFKDLDYVRNYYYEKVKPRVDSLGRYSSKYSSRAAIRRKNTSKYKEGRDLTLQLEEVLRLLKSRKQQGTESKS